MNYRRFCDEIPLESVMDCSRPTLNQTLAGAASERTLRSIEMAPPVQAQQSAIINSRGPRYPRASGWGEFAVPLQPGIYTVPDTVQAINSSIGISTLPIELYVEQMAPCAPLVPTPVPTQPTGSTGPTAAPSPPPIQLSWNEHDTDPNLSSVYDPRLSGYGADDRSYIEPCIGQVRYFYDDIDAIRMPSYITRNKIDTCLTPAGDSYGDVNSGSRSLNTIRPDIEKSWTDHSLDFRTDMMSHLMRKRNAELLQIRQAPRINN